MTSPAHDPEGRDVNAFVWRALASRLGLELPGPLPVTTLERLVAAEIRRREWKLDPPCEPAHGTRSRYRKGCRCEPCRTAANDTRLGNVPTLRLRWHRRSGGHE